MGNDQVEAVDTFGVGEVTCVRCLLLGELDFIY